MIQNEILNNLEALVETQGFSLYRANKEHELGGRFVQELEALFCEYFDVKYAVAMNSATACLHSACVACGAGKNYSAIVPVVTFSASASCVYMAGGRPEFVDIEPDTYCLDPMLVRPMEGHTKAIIVVHLHGHPAAMNALPRNVPIIEDCSQAIGAEYESRKVGTIGACGIFSFNQSKQIQCGEGGMFITNDENIANIARLMRNHGETQANILGYNYRMTELQAAVVIPQFKRLDEINEQTIELAEYLTELLNNVDNIQPPVVRPNCKHVYYTYPVRVNVNRDELQTALMEAGVYFGKGGYKPLNHFPFYREIRKREYPVAEDCYRNVMFTNIIKPPITKGDIDKIVEKIKVCLEDTGRASALKGKLSGRETGNKRSA